MCSSDLVTYQPVAISGVQPLKGQLVRPKATIAVYLLLPVAAAVLLVLANESPADGMARPLLIAGGSLLVVAWPILMWRAWRRNRAGTRLGRELSARLQAGAKLAEEDVKAIQAALGHSKLAPADREYQCQLAYFDLLTTIVRDGRVANEELELLANVEKILALGADFVADARVDSFRQVYMEAVADHDLAEEEERRLEHIQQTLGVQSAAIEPEKDALARLSDIRSIREGTLPVIEPTVPLQKAERCFYEAPGRLLKEKNLRSFQRDGQRYQVRGLVIDKEGTLLVTDKRLLLVHQGTTTVKLDRILDLEIDQDQNILSITKDGAQTPILITTPDCVKAGATIAAACRL